MRRTKGYLFVAGVLLLHTLFSSLMQNTWAEEYAASDDPRIDVSESVEEEETGQIQYPEELEKYVQNIVDNTDPMLILADPQMDHLKQYLYEMEQVYPDKSYDELREMLRTVKTEEEYLEMIGEYEAIEGGNASSNIDASINASSTTATSTGATLGDLEWRNSCNYICRKSDPWENEEEFGNFIYSSSHSHFLPGLKVTNVAGSDCKDMIPQGICKVGSYLFISAYCEKKAHNSVIYVLSSYNMQYQCTLKTEIKAHLGGIAYDESKYLWVCDSDSGTMRAYDMSNLNTMIGTAKSRLHKTYSINSSAVRWVEITPSFCTYHDGMLWVGEWLLGEASEAIAYSVNGLTLTRGASMGIPAESQGMSIYRSGNGVYCAFTTSYGRNNESTVYRYTILDYNVVKNPSYILGYSNGKTISMPSMMEGICNSSYSVYAIFESAANKYRNGDGNGYSAYACDRICEFSPTDIYK